MKLNLDVNPNLNLVTGYGADHLMINKVRHDGNLVVTTDRIVTGWAQGGFDALRPEDFEAVRALQVEIVIIGTGARQRFPRPQIMRPLIDARVGFEVMDFAAACRTYNILASEGRSVAAALLFDPA
ncbi:MAG TPA: Mth938-like domain-containing protein [Aromatoleum sp.]|uniref:Mth938-like domain-containing protein n=1 Tax=Aromatoleum sp. TaxID=2307007 RepID=UPI002B45BDDC|nr:Mth938-like domain-containing protein [Aromatoleum sp.]HJV28173.1 Mth938-like domain-containing protein [Aromatoleum sp.]